MSPERWRRIEAVFHAALVIPTGERALYLDGACAADASMRDEVESLLAAHLRRGGILDCEPAVDVAGMVEAVDPGAIATDTPVIEATATRCPICGTHHESEDLQCTERGEPLVDDPVQLAGTLFDGLYEVERLLGRGGMGAVYLARHALLDDRVAIKVLPRGLHADPEWLARFMREGRAARAIQHPNAVVVHDLRATSDGLTYLVLEYVEGRTLRAALAERGRFTAREALDALEPVAGALDEAHSLGIVHRDLKPENIMLGASAVKLLDLGIAKYGKASETGSARPASEGGAQLTRAGSWIGTPAYMPPEQWGEIPSDGNLEIDGRADVYGLGVVVYELVTGRRPISGSTPMEYWEAHVTTVPEPADAIVPEIPERFARAIDQALAKDRSDRHPSAGAFVAELRAAVTGADAPNNLPRPATSFVGRRRQIVDAREALEASRLVTLVGPGGIGKTRFAVEVARTALDRYRDGVWLVELAGLGDPSLVPAALASVLGVEEDASRPLTETLRDALKSKELLLVIDNCEHLVEACAAFVETVLRASASIRVLATSREALGVSGEALWPVPPLSLHAVDSTEPPSASEAVRLFVERAKLGTPEFDLTAGNGPAVAELCRMLEGIPLAIELAAARLRVLSVEQIVEKMNDRFRLLTTVARTTTHRHQTLRAAIDWSYELLGETERMLLARLSVFAPSWSLEAAETIGGQAPLCDADVLELLTRFVDKSLVTVDSSGGRARYRTLETIREYAREKLVESGEEPALLRSHRDWYLELAEAAMTEYDGPRKSEWVRTLETELDNMRAAIGWSLFVARDAEASLRLTVALGLFLQFRGSPGEAQHLIEQALALGDAPPRLRSDALFRLAQLAVGRGDYARALSSAEECVALGRGLGDDAGLARATNYWGLTACFMGQYDLGRTILEENLALCRRLGLDEHANRALRFLGIRAILVGELERAMACFEEILPIFRRAGNGLHIGMVLIHIGEVARLMDDFDRARTVLDEARAIARELGSTHMLAAASESLAEVLSSIGDWDGAVPLFEEAMATYPGLPHAEAFASLVGSIALAVARRGDAVRAACLSEAAANLRSGMALPEHPVDQMEQARWLDPAIATLAAEDLRQARDRGRAMTPERAADYARDALRAPATARGR